MLTVMNRIRVHPDYADAFEERFRTRAGLVDTMPGFIRNEVLRPAQPGKPYIVLTYWESREAFEAWTTSDAFKQGHARSGSLPKEAFDGPSELEIHEVFLNSDTRPQGEPA
ncbi:antibiotic biosynthesis monooxygenase [Deinococcus sp. HMF7620]|uniref:Antibiotic biosynthesis monooxygenase n=1 Tax=Deinococcus arboris TaxID=2682977 RepID=A0A7C9I4Y4_9DEIO|nr:MULTISPECIES: antibiotic biosynthesis monooxygenase [Deinococcus]MBZ9753051.1 antibiotic biosynthesis monooxygenase [Deinococcus betulae]MVN88531.1 antibiotic biosynthesis monooxygenase [Deinococcus arboris]